MKRWENEGLMESDPQKHQIWNVSIFQKMSMVLDLWLIQTWAQL